MKNLLRKISEKAIILNDYDFTAEQVENKWLGTEPASDAAISDREKYLGVALPGDYWDFLKITNGFPQYISTGVSFAPVEQIDYLRKFNEDLVDIWRFTDGLEEIGNALYRSILIGGINEEQYFLLIPPLTDNEPYKYWSFSNWAPGEQEFVDLQAYLEQELSILEEFTEGKTEPIKRFVVDYTLLQHVFKHEWKLAYEKAFEWFIENKNYWYVQSQMDLIQVMLLCTQKLDSFQVFESDQKDLYAAEPNGKWLLYHTEKLNVAIENKDGFIDGMEMHHFIPKEDPITLGQIERQIESVRPDLLREKNASQKIEYQLYFLFGGGNAKEFIDLYEKTDPGILFSRHENAAIVYIKTDQPDRGKNALRRYYEINQFPLYPFFSRVLNPIMDKEFCEEIWKNMDGKLFQP